MTYLSSNIPFWFILDKVRYYNKMAYGLLYKLSIYFIYKLSQPLGNCISRYKLPWAKSQGLFCEVR